MTDKITPATGKEIEDARHYLYGGGGLRVAPKQCVYTNEEVARFIARIEAQQAEIERLNKIGDKFQQDYLEEANKLDHARAEIERLRELIASAKPFVIHSARNTRGDDYRENTRVIYEIAKLDRASKGEPNAK